MQKKIGIVTVGRGLLLTNYGSFFQHYALREVLKRLGYDPFRCESDTLKSELWELLMPVRSRWSWIRDTLLRRGRRPVVPFNWSVRRLSFMCSYKDIIGPLFEPQSDVAQYIVGGDCVWFNVSPSMFLIDKPKTARKLSYAVSSSWGKMEKMKKWRELIQQVGVSYDAISVRESAGREIVENITKRTVAQVLDPVFMLDKSDYLKIASKKRVLYRPTLIYYAVNCESGEDLDLPRVCDWAKELDLDIRVIGIQGAESFVSNSLALRPSPVEFLNLVEEAKCIVTNSFHGIVFSVVFNKPFVFVPQKSNKWGNQNQRQQELLSLVSLDKRFVGEDEPKDNVVRLLVESLPKEVHDTVRRLKDNSVKWLREALSSGEHK